jgi:diguanylate cyclase (GGDEF)-like protein
LVIIDIDHFKKHNDNYGHPAGDVVLVVLADLLKTHMKRANDTVFRLGGEEFALIYEVQSRKSAWDFTENVRLCVETLHVDENIADKITVSAGLLIISAFDEISAEKAYSLADELLYQAKHSGRNKVVMSPSDVKDSFFPSSNSEVLSV